MTRGRGSGTQGGDRPRSRLVVLATVLALALHPFLAASSAAVPAARDDLVPVCTGSGLVWVDPTDPAVPFMPRPPAKTGGLHLCCFLSGKQAVPATPTAAVPFHHPTVWRLPPPRDPVPAGPPALDTASARGPPPLRNV